ncbi:MAG: polysaccharide biosynthesis/export family protein [Blastocatellia bacterium]|nr:polysaccharide biosynthesis/export family protein [Blastocatellia bacterium]
MISRILLFPLWLLCLLTLAVHAQTPEILLTGPSYQLHPGDVIEVQYRLTPEFNQTVTVQPDGYVTLSLAGALRIGELTLTQAQQLIITKSSTRLKDPEVTLLLKEFQKPYFVVAGEVAQPGKIELREKVTALQAILLAGGFKESARSSQILLFRKVNSDEAEVIVVDLKKLKRTDDLSHDVMLKPGDMLLVPTNTVTKVGRFIKLVNLGLFFNPFDLVRPR